RPGQIDDDRGGELREVQGIAVGVGGLVDRIAAEVRAGPRAFVGPPLAANVHVGVAAAATRQEVIAGAAFQDVVPGAGGERVFAGGAHEVVVGGIPGDGVVARRADDVFHDPANGQRDIRGDCLRGGLTQIDGNTKRAWEGEGVEAIARLLNLRRITTGG